MKILERLPIYDESTRIDVRGEVGRRRGPRLAENPAGCDLDIPFRPGLDDELVGHGRALARRRSFSSASNTASIGLPSPRSTEARLSLTTWMVSSRSARSLLDPGVLFFTGVADQPLVTLEIEAVGLCTSSNGLRSREIVPT